MSIQLVARARDAGVIISPRDVFDHKSVAALAESAHLEQDRPDVLAELPGSAVGTVPLSPVAQWMLDRSSGGLRGGGVKRFSQALLLTAPADLTQDLLVRGLQVLLDRHGMLRARLVESDRVMEVLPPGSISAEGLIHRVAVDSVDDEGFRALASGELEAVADSLDPATADMVRVIWFDLADKPDVSTGRGRLLVVIHHLVVDGVSWRILVTDLASVTAQLQAGVTPELPQIGTSFRRWAHGLVEHVGDRSVELDIWKTILDGDDPLIGSRPLDPTIDVDDTVDTVTVDISPSATRNLLTTVPAAFHAGVNDGLVTAVALASIEWRRRRGMDTAAALITLEGHGREEGAVPGADLARTVGWFTTLYRCAWNLAQSTSTTHWQVAPTPGGLSKLSKSTCVRSPIMESDSGCCGTCRARATHSADSVLLRSVSTIWAGSAPLTEHRTGCRWRAIEGSAEPRTVHACGVRDRHQRGG